MPKAAPRLPKAASVKVTLDIGGQRYTSVKSTLTTGRAANSAFVDILNLGEKLQKFIPGLRCRVVIPSLLVPVCYKEIIQQLGGCAFQPRNAVLLGYRLQATGVWASAIGNAGNHMES